MILQLEISLEAEYDLLEIWLFIAEDQPINADRFLDMLYEKVKKLSEFPDLGRDRPELGYGLKSFPVERYNLYYAVTASKLILVRVLPGDRDLAAIF